MASSQQRLESELQQARDVYDSYLYEQSSAQCQQETFSKSQVCDTTSFVESATKLCLEMDRAKNEICSASQRAEIYLANMQISPEKISEATLKEGNMGGAESTSSTCSSSMSCTGLPEDDTQKLKVRVESNSMQICLACPNCGSDNVWSMGPVVRKELVPRVIQYQHEIRDRQDNETEPSTPSIYGKHGQIVGDGKESHGNNSYTYSDQGDYTAEICGDGICEFGGVFVKLLKRRDNLSQRNILDVDR